VALLLLYAVAIAAVLGASFWVLPYENIGSVFGFALNVVEYGFLSLLSFQVYRRETIFRGVFYQFWILFTMLALSVPVVNFVYFFTGAWGGVIAYELMLIFLHGLFLWIVAKTLFGYIFHDEKRWAINLLSTLVVLPLCLWLFWPYYWSPEVLMLLPTGHDSTTLYQPLQKSIVVVNIVALLMLVAFFLHKLRTDRPIGVFADTLLFLFLLFCLFDTAEVVFRITSVELMNITQWAMGAVAAAMIVTLLLRLKYKSQSISHYYESQILSFDPRVGRRIGLFDRFILWCFFDPEAVGQRIFLGPNRQKMSVKRSSPRVARKSSE
jgi:hypothetical protein